MHQIFVDGDISILYYGRKDALRILINLKYVELQE